MARTDAWKDTEREVARRLGGHRLGATGKATEDVATEAFAVEGKFRKTIPEWIKDAMSQAVGAARDGRTPICVLHEKGKRHDGDYVLLRLRDFEDLYGRVEVPE